MFSSLCYFLFSSNELSIAAAINNLPQECPLQSQGPRVSVNKRVDYNMCVPITNMIPFLKNILNQSAQLVGSCVPMTIKSPKHKEQHNNDNTKTNLASTVGFVLKLHCGNLNGWTNGTLDIAQSRNPKH